MPAYAEIEIPWDRQPQEAAGWGTPTAPIFFINAATGIDEVTSAGYTQRHGSYPAVVKTGIGGRHYDTSAHPAAGAQFVMQQKSGASIGFDLVWAGYFTSFSSSNSFLSTKTTGTVNYGSYGGQWTLAPNASGNLVFSAHFNNAWESVTTAATLAVNKLHTIRVLVTTVGVDIWIDGQKESFTTTATTETSIGTAIGATVRIGSTGGSYDGNVNARTLFTAGYSERALDGYECNPWQLFAPSSIWVPVSAGGGPPPATLSSYYHQMMGNYHV